MTTALSAGRDAAAMTAALSAVSAALSALFTAPQLDLSENELLAEDVEALATPIGSSSSLTSLSLAQNSLHLSLQPRPGGGSGAQPHPSALLTLAEADAPRELGHQEEAVNGGLVDHAVTNPVVNRRCQSTRLRTDSQVKIYSATGLGCSIYWQ